MYVQINDLGFEAVHDPASGQLLFNVVVGGYFSLKRNIMSVPLGVAVTEQQIIPFTVALLRVFRWGQHATEGLGLLLETNLQAILKLSACTSM